MPETTATYKDRIETAKEMLEAELAREERQRALLESAEQLRKEEEYSELVLNARSAANNRAMLASQKAWQENGGSPGEFEVEWPEIRRESLRRQAVSAVVQEEKPARRLTL
jgi:hypothetical protein